MSNEQTILKFYGSTEGEIPWVEPADLDRLCNSLSFIHSSILEDLGLSNTVRYGFASSPRRGSLEVALLHVLGTVTGAASSEVAAAIMDRVQDLARGQEAGIAALLYTTVFGGKGLVDLRLNGNDQSAPLPASPITELKLTASSAVLSLQTVQAINQMVLNASATGASKIEITVLDDRPVPIYGGDLRRNPFRVASSTKFKPRRGDVRHVARAEGAVLNAEWLGTRATIFLGTASPNEAEGTVAVIWTSKQPIPPIFTAADVQGQHLNLDDLLNLSLREDWPPDFDVVTGVVLVTGMASYD